jgi:hypothetical protein
LPLIRKPTSAKDAEVCIRGSYAVDWKPVRGDLMYAVIDIGKAKQSHDPSLFQQS